MTECDDVYLLANDSMSEVVNALMVNGEALNRCNSKHNALIEQIRKSEYE